MTFDASDRLLQVGGLASGIVLHTYGHDGARIKTVAPDGSVSYLFGDGTADHNGVREHDVTVGERVVARVAMTAAGDGTGGTGGSGGDGPGGPGGGPAGAMVTDVATSAPVGLGLLALALSLIVARPRLQRRARAAGMVCLALATACSTPRSASRAQPVLTPVATFMHAGFAAGPVVFTDATGHLVEERRFEPFGAPIDAHTVSAGIDTIGAPDLANRDLNALNKRTDVATGWSDHGARWMAPETGRWLSTDPPVSSPDAKFMDAPWALHPYQYADQNPIVYWDPDGREPGAIAGYSPDVHAAVVRTVAEAAEALRPLAQSLARFAPIAVAVGYVLWRPDTGSAYARYYCGRSFVCAQLRFNARQAEANRQAVLAEMGRIRAKADANPPAAQEGGTAGGDPWGDPNDRRALPRYDGPKPTYEVNDAHVPGRGLRSSNPKTPLPSDAELVYRNAVPGSPTQPRAWYGKNGDGQVYRYSTNADGTAAHFSGIDTPDIPKYATQRLGEK